MKLTDKQIVNYLDDLTDPRRIYPMCKIHGYYGKGMPTAGCKRCWEVYFALVIGQTPPHKREEMRERLTKLVMDSCALEDKGLFDFRPFAHPHVKIEKGGEN